MRILKTIFAAALFLILSASAFAQHHNDLAWQAGAGGGTVTGFNVKRATVSGGPYATIQTVAATTLVCSDSSGLVEGSHRFYVVTATGPGGESAPSNEVDLLTPFSAPAAPAALTGVPH